MNSIKSVKMERDPPSVSIKNTRLFKTRYARQNNTCVWDCRLKLHIRVYRSSTMSLANWRQNQIEKTACILSDTLKSINSSEKTSLIISKKRLKNKRRRIFFVDTWHESFVYGCVLSNQHKTVNSRYKLEKLKKVFEKSTSKRTTLRKIKGHSLN